MIRRPCQGRETQGELPASKIPAPLFQERLEPGSPCLPRADDVLGALPAFTSHPHNNFMRQILIISVLQKRKLELRVGRTGPRHLVRRAAPEFEPRSSDCEKHQPPRQLQPPRSLARGLGSQEPEALPARAQAQPGLPGDTLTVRTSCPAAPASPCSGPPRSAPPGPRGCSASPVAPMAPPTLTTPARLCQ